MNDLDHLHDLLDRRSDDADGIHPDVSTVYGRARHRRRTGRAVGALASVALVAAVAVGARELAGGRGQPVSSAADAPTTTTMPSSTRTLSATESAKVWLAPEPTTYGPYGGDGWWTAPADCQTLVEVAVKRDDPQSTAVTAVTGWVLTVAPLERSDPRPHAVGSRVMVGGPTDEKERPVVVVVDATAGDTYRLVKGSAVLDSTSADSTIVALIGPAQPSPSGDDPNEATSRLVEGLRVERIAGDGSVHDLGQPVAEAYSADDALPARCTTPTIQPGTPPADPQASGDAASAAVTALTPPGPGGDTIVPTRVVWSSPTQGWVRYELRSTGGTALDSPAQWAEVTLDEGGTWTVSRTSRCILDQETARRCGDVPMSVALGPDGSVMVGAMTTLGADGFLSPTGTQPAAPTTTAGPVPTTGGPATTGAGN